MNMMMISNCGKYLCLNRHSADQDFIYIFKIYIEFRSFGGICCGGILTLQKTKNNVWWPRQTKLLVGFGLRFLRVFMGLDEFLQVFDVFFCGLWRSCFIKGFVD